MTGQAYRPPPDPRGCGRDIAAFLTLAIILIGVWAAVGTALGWW